MNLMENEKYYLNTLVLHLLIVLKKSNPMVCAFIKLVTSTMKLNLKTLGILLTLLMWINITIAYPDLCLSY